MFETVFWFYVIGLLYFEKANELSWLHILMFKVQLNFNFNETLFVSQCEIFAFEYNLIVSSFEWHL